MNQTAYNGRQGHYPRYYQYGYVFVKVCSAERYISVVLMPGNAAANVSTGTNPDTALPYLTAEHNSDEAKFLYAYEKAVTLIQL